MDEILSTSAAKLLCHHTVWQKPAMNPGTHHSFITNADYSFLLCVFWSDTPQWQKLSPKSFCSLNFHIPFALINIIFMAFTWLYWLNFRSLIVDTNDNHCFTWEKALLNDAFCSLSPWWPHEEWPFNKYEQHLGNNITNVTLPKQMSRGYTEPVLLLLVLDVTASYPLFPFDL